MTSKNDHPRRRGRALFQTLAGGLAAWLVLGAGSASAFETIGSKWSQPNLTLYVGLNGTGFLGKGGLSYDWDAAFAEAAQQWTDMTDFDYTFVNQFSDPCDTSAQGLAQTGVDFDTTKCGANFDDAYAAAIILTLGGEIIRGEIVFDSDPNNWAVYDGPWKPILVIPGGGISELWDFRRIALHELGHLLGLDHSAEASIMNVTAANRFDREVLTQDDIDGVAAIYSSSGGGTTGCTVDTDCASGLVCNAGECIQPDDHGDTMGEATELSPSDIPLAAFLDDPNDIDYFQFGVTDDGAGRILTISTTGTTDTAGMLYDGSGSLLASNSDASATDVNFSIVQAIASGGTFYIAVSSDASGPGPYTLNLSVSKLCATNSAIAEDDPACVAGGTTGGDTTDGDGGGGGGGGCVASQGQRVGGGLPAAVLHLLPLAVLLGLRRRRAV